MSGNSDSHATSWTVRLYRPDDQGAVSRLFAEGLLAGQMDPHDTGADIENIHEAYLSHPTNRFWVADVSGEVRGMIGVIREDNHVAEIRRLRVSPDWQHTDIPHRLIETALMHCRHEGFLKVVLDTRFEKTAALDVFTRLGFQHTRTKSIHGKDLLEFYLDLYRPKKEGQD